MDLCQEVAFRDFWYAVTPLRALSDRPISFTLLGTPIVLWLDQEGNPAAIHDRCSHRGAALSRGRVREGLIECPYHGWSFQRDGRCVGVPQRCANAGADRRAVPGYTCRAAYGHVWVCLGAPRSEIPHVPEAERPDFRRVDCFDETWQASPLRVMENELDMAHFSHVHRGTFGDDLVADPLEYAVFDRGPLRIGVRAVLAVKADALQGLNTGMGAGRSTRTMEIEWFMPATVVLTITYESGLRHVIVNNATPIDAGRMQLVQFHYRNDAEEAVPAAQLLAFERRIVDEDRRVIESIAPDFPLDTASETHIYTDRAGLLMRRKISALLADRGALRVIP